jgi:hypothetical protein
MTARPDLREELRLELRLKVFEMLLRNGYSLNNPVPFKEHLDKIEAMVLGDPAPDESRGNPDVEPPPAKAGKGKT